MGAIRVYGGAILKIDPDSLTSADLRKLAVSDQIAHRSAAVLNESEGAHFGTLHEAHPEARPDASLLKALRRDFHQHESANRSNKLRRSHR